MEKQRVDLHRLISIMKRHRNLVYIIFAIAIVLATVINSLPPMYEAKVTIRVKPTVKGLIDNTGATWSSEELARQKMYTFAELIKNRSVVEAAIGKLSANEQVSVNYEKVVGRITVRPLKDTEILNMFVLAGSPQEAQNLANALAVAFNERMQEVVRAESKEARIFIGDRLAEKKRDLDNAEKALVEYKEKNQVIAINEQAKNLAERQSALKKLEAENQLALEAAYAKQNSPSIIADTPVLQQYRSRIAEQEAELASLLQNMTAEHPRVINLQASIAENRANLQNELARIAQGEVSLGETQKTTLQRITSQGKQESARMPATETRLARLMLDYSVAESVYTIIAKRYEEARISEVMEPTNVQIFDMASLPGEPVKPRKTFNLCIAGFLGLFFGTMSTFVAEYFCKTIDTAEDLQQYLPVRLIGNIPRLEANLSWKVGKTKLEGEPHG